MDKQQIAHTLTNEIKIIDNALTKLQEVQSRTFNYHQAMDLHMAIKDLITHKQKLENIVENIVEDAKNYNPTLGK